MNEQRVHIDTIIATLNEVNSAIARRYSIVRGNKGSWAMRARGILDAMEIVESMRQRVVMDVMQSIEAAKAAQGKPAGLPEGLTQLTPEEVAAREASVPETAWQGSQDH